MRNIEDILRSTTRCTITEYVPDEDDFYYYEWKHAKQAAETYLKESMDELYEKIKHGDKEHQAWLRKEMTSFVNEKIGNNSKIKKNKK